MTRPGSGGARARAALPVVLSGVLFGASFQPWGVWFLALAALAPFFAILVRLGDDPRPPYRRAFGTGYLFGAASFALQFHWLLFLSAPEVPNHLVMLPLTLLVVGYLSLYPALFALGLVACARRTRIPAPLLAPPLWLAAEWLRGRGEMGFPWGNAGDALASSLPFLQLASVVGATGLSLLAVSSNAAFASAWNGRGRARRLVPVGAVALLAAAYAWGARRLADHPADEGATMRVALVQPNLVMGIKWDWEYKDRCVEAVVRLSRRVAPGEADLAVWPETAVPVYLGAEPEYFGIVKRTVAATGTPTLLGYPDTQLIGQDREYYNAALLLQPDGTVAGGYRKIHLVPFGEAIPFQSIFPALRGVDFGEADFTPGRDLTLFTAAGQPFAVSICFEAIFPDLTRAAVRKGAGFLVNITNDAWFGRSSAPWQHAQLSVIRAVEDGVSLVRCANTGISLVSDRFGRTSSRTPLFEEAVAFARIDPRPASTFYLRHGEVVRAAALAAAAAALLAAAFPPPRLARRRRGAP